MYKRILLASDGSRETLVALREGALIAKAVRAEAFLLIVERETPGRRVADAVHPLPTNAELTDLLTLGLARLERLGVKARGELAVDEPAKAIGAAARRFAADLVVVGYRRQGALERWWSGGSGAYLVDHVGCSLLIARNLVSDDEFEAAIAAAEAQPA